MTNNINIIILKNGTETQFEAPDDSGLNLMEFLKAAEQEEIEGLCGGMALCATCHVRLLESDGQPGNISEEESAMLETLPKLYENSRLACQIKLTPNIKKLKIQIT